MSTRRNKRRRSDPDAKHLFDDDGIVVTSPKYPSGAEEPEPHPTQAEQEPQPEGEEDAEASAKEREVWDAFREEHYELLEQLPLSLHRAFTLIHELDQQAQDNITQIAPAVLKYVQLRKDLAAAAQPKVDAPTDSGEPNGETNGHADGSGDVPMTNGNTSNGVASPSAATATPGPSSKRQTPATTSKSLASVVESSTSTRELLVHIAQSSEEVTRACAEKVYLAQHAYDLVDRYIRDLDRAIKEQEASISLGLRPGTHPASIILPEVVPPQSSRGRVVATPPPPSVVAPIFVPASSPVPVPAPAPVEPPPQPAEVMVEPTAEHTVEATQEPAVELSDQPVEEPVEEVDIMEVTDEAPQPEVPAPEAPIEAETAAPAPAPKEKKKGKKRRSGRRQTTRATAADETAEPAGDVTQDAVAPPEEVQAPLTLRIPAQAIAQTPLLVDDLPPDPNEPRYCFCNQVSFGDMIACDNPTCTREWFHIGCVGLTRIPKGNWYCRECAALRKRAKSRKRAR